jgi:ABC-2 type transport system permease protein
MNKTLLVLRNEITTAFTRKSFLFTAFGLPVIAALIFLGVSLLKGNASGAPDTSGGSSGSPDKPELQVEGYIDQSGLITAITSDVPEGILIAYPDQASARQALKAGEIAAYYIIPADYIEKGDLIYINPDYNLASSQGQSWVMRRTIFENLLGNDPERIDRARHAMDVQVNALAPSKVQHDSDGSATFLVPYGTMMIFYFVILMSSTLMLNSVSEEKKNRTMETLLVSISPRQILTGKIFGLGTVGLLQAAIWAGTGYTLLRVGGETFSLPPDFELPISILAWGIVFFLLGYGVYASLMAGMGALVPNLKEASQATILVIWPMLVPMFLFVSLIERTHGVLATGLSLFPLTAPIAMMTRLAVGGVPLWQPLLAAGLLLATVFLIVRAVSRMFHAQILLSGQPFSARRFFAALLRRT